jgi:hypothetical protein
MNFGILYKLKQKNLNEDEINEILKKEKVLLEIKNVASVQLNLGEEPQKISFFERILKVLFNKKTKDLIKPKYSSFEKKVLINLNDYKVRKYYTTNFKEEIYYYIINLFESIINMKFQLLSNDLNREVEVYSNQLKKDGAIKKNFVKIFRRVVDDYSLESRIVNNVDILPVQKKYFSYLKEVQNQLINNIQNYPVLLDAYLEGNKTLIEEELLSSCQIIQEIIDFKFNYKFLLALNKEYNIEEASKDIIDEKYFQIQTEFPQLFEDIEVLVFTYNKINSFTELFPSNISSLFYALTERGLVLNNKAEFIRYVSKVHGINTSKIRKDDLFGLTPFKLRFNQFLEEIDTQIPSKKS